MLMCDGESQLLLVFSKYARCPLVCEKQLLLVCEFAHWCAKNDNFCWCANSHTGVRKKNYVLWLVLHVLCNTLDEAARMKATELLTKSVHSPSGVQKFYRALREAPSLGVD